MEVISSIYNSGYNIKKFYLGSRELNLAYLGNQVIYDEVIGDNDLNYILYEFYGSDTLPNTVEAPVKSAILSGSTKYRDIDTGEFLETFEEGRNLELVSVKMPVLTTSGVNVFFEDNTMEYGAWASNGIAVSTTSEIRCKNKHTPFPKGLKNGDKMYIVLSDTSINSNTNMHVYDENKTYLSPSNRGCTVSNFVNGVAVVSINDIAKCSYFSFRAVSSNINCEFALMINDCVPYEPFKSNILTVNEDVTLRSNGDICDELNLLTGQLTQRIGEDGVVLSQEVVKTVDLTIVDQDGKTINKLNSFNGTTHVSTDVAENSAYPMVSLEVASELQAAMSKVTEDIELIKPVQNDIETTIDTQSNDIDSLLLATTELFEMFL